MRKSPVDELVEQLKAKPIDMKVRMIPSAGSRVYICFISQMVDRQALSEFIIKPVTQHCAQSNQVLNAAVTIDSVLYADDCKISNNLADVEFDVLNGQTVILFSNDTQYVIVNRKKVEKRNVSTPELMYSALGPRDSFVESLDTNLSLLRYRLKDGSICIEQKEVGKRTKSSVAIVYLTDVARPEVVKEINKKIDSINTDGIYETGELQKYLIGNKNYLFPRMGLIERSDMAVEKLLEGKVIVLVDGSCIALNAPVVFAELLYSCDDRYDNKFFGMFMRIIRYLAILFSLTLTSIYVALAEFHPDAMPASYIVTFAELRSRAPFSGLIAVLSLELILELMREALLRVPVKIGSAIAIVGAIIIGQAASSSGIYSPLLLIFASIGFLSTFAITDFALSNAIRIIKFGTILMTGFFGFYGFSIYTTLILALFVSVDSFGVPYTAPWAPYNPYDAKRTLIFSKRTSPKREQFMRDQDDTRAPRN